MSAHFLFIILFVYMSHILRTSTEHITAPLADEALMHMASLEARTTFNTYNLWKLALRGHLNTDARMRDRTRNFLITRTLARPNVEEK